MNKAQTKAVEAIKARIVAMKSHGGADKYEFKTFETSDPADTALVFLVTEYGNIGDENDMRSLMCRDRRHFAIGKRGGVKLLSLDTNLKSSNPKNVRGVFNAVNYYHPEAKAAR